MVEQVNSPVYAKLEGNLGVTLPTTLHLNLLLKKYGVKERDGYSFNTPISIVGSVVGDQARVYIRQSFEVSHNEHKSTVNVIYYAETLGIDGNNSIPLEELPEGVVDQDQKIISLAGLDKLLAVPKQIVHVSVYPSALSLQDHVDYNLSFEMRGETLVSVGSDFFVHIVNGNNGTPMSYQDTLQLLTGGYSGLLNGSKEEIESQGIDGRLTIEEIVTNLVPAIVRKFS